MLECCGDVEVSGIAHDHSVFWVARAARVCLSSPLLGSEWGRRRWRSTLTTVDGECLARGRQGAGRGRQRSMA
eukprot:5135199-Pyramimonas_sp.AAC.1